jgi:hypothetical protein
LPLPLPLPWPVQAGFAPHALLDHGALGPARNRGIGQNPCGVPEHETVSVSRAGFRFLEQKNIENAKG